MSENIYALFASRFPADRRAPFLELPEGRGYSYADLDIESARFARFLADRGVVPGDRVAVQVEKSPQALFFHLGCLRAGFVYVPLDTAYRRTEIEYFLDDAAPAAVVRAPALRDTVHTAAVARGIERVYTLDADGRGTLTEAAARPTSASPRSRPTTPP